MVKIPILINKKNGQINSYFKSKQLPKGILDKIRKKPSGKLIVHVKGWANG